MKALFFQFVNCLIMGAQENQTTQETVNGAVDSNAATPVANYKDSSFKGNEDRY